MKLALRLVSLVVLAILAAVAVDGYWSFRREVRLYDADMRKDAHLIGSALKTGVTEAWKSGGMDRAFRILEATNQREPQLGLRWVWLDASSGAPNEPQIPRDILGEVARGVEKSFHKRNEIGEKETLLTYIPVSVDARRRGAIELSQDMSARHDFKRRSIRRTVGLTVVLVGLSGSLSLLLGVVMVGKPLRSLTEKARRIGAGDLSGPVRVRGRTELSDLARSMNGMCEQLVLAHENLHAESGARIALMEQLRHAERLKMVGTLSAGVAHELGTPLNVVSGRAHLIESGDLSEAEISESAGIIRTQCARMTATIQQLLGFARSSSSSGRQVQDLRPLIERCVKLLTPVADKYGVSLRLVGDDGAAPVKTNADEVQQVLTNLIMNSLHATSDGGIVEVGIRRTQARSPEGDREGAFFCLWVRDEGDGIADSDLAHVFEPFFTTKQVGEGTGLGLSIAFGIVRDLGGWIEVRSKVGEGSCFLVYLPPQEAGCRNES